MAGASDAGAAPFDRRRGGGDWVPSDPEICPRLHHAPETEHPSLPAAGCDRPRRAGDHAGRLRVAPAPGHLSAGVGGAEHPEIAAPGPLLAGLWPAPAICVSRSSARMEAGEW